MALTAMSVHPRAINPRTSQEPSTQLGWVNQQGQVNGMVYLGELAVDIKEPAVRGKRDAQ